MVTKSSPQYISEDEIQFYNKLNECDRRRYVAIRANGLGYNGVCKVTKIYGIDKESDIAPFSPEKMRQNE